MINNIECKLALVEDLDQVLKIDNSLFELDKYSIQTFKDAIENDTQKLIVASADNNVVGYILFSYIMDEAELLKIGVTTQYQRLGVGKLLHDSMLQNLKEQSVKNIFLEVRIDNNSAIKFYEKNGYEKVTIREKYYQGTDAVIYRKGI